MLIAFTCALLHTNNNKVSSSEAVDNQVNCNRLNNTKKKTIIIKNTEFMLHSINTNI